MIDYNLYEQPTKDTVCSWEGYLYFVWEREAVRLDKEMGHHLTCDPVIRDYRFTNIRRRDDRMTQWMLEHLMQPFKKRADLWFTMLIARLVNWPPTLHALLNYGIIPSNPIDFSPERFSEVVEACKLGGKVFGSAYMIYPTMMDPGGKKSYAVAKYIIGDAVKQCDSIDNALWDDDPSVERFVTTLSKVFGVSTFIAGQVAADLTYVDDHLSGAFDIYSYAPLGPGSQLGLNLLLGHKRNHMWSQQDFNKTLMLANAKIRDELDIADLTLHDVQNTMCEYSKYAQAVLGIKRPRRLYTSETAY